MNTVLIIGTGLIGLEHAKAAKQVGWTPILVSRSPEKARQMSESTGFKVICCDSKSLKTHFPNSIPQFGVVAVPVTSLAQTAIDLASIGVKNLLLEKPAVVHSSELADLQSHLNRCAAKAWIAYNRRCYASVQELRKLCAQDGGITSIHFEFTEWSHVIEGLADTPRVVKENWLLANSSHVIDLAFFIAGAPREFSHFKSGKLSWHPSGSVFVGSGITENDVLFSYNANWESAGRWGVEVCTNKAKYILRPLEGLQIMKRGSVAAESLPIVDSADKMLKAGFLNQMTEFLSLDSNRFSGSLCSIENHGKHIKFYDMMIS